LELSPIPIENITGIPDGWSSVEAFLKSSKGLPIADKTNNFIIGKIGKVIMEDGVVKGITAKIYVDCIPKYMQDLKIYIPQN
jgi:hypothetical protein